MVENTLPLYAAAKSQPASRRFFRILNDTAKRGLDLLAACIGLILLAPFFAWIAWRIKQDSPGPVFYWGRRQGHKGQAFRILKFRTMYENPASYSGPLVTAGGDPRVTPFGSWLRRTKINEVPQLWNVLTGEMSLVGPRPEDPEIFATLPTETQEELVSVRPGVTSPASVLYRDEESLLQGGPVMNLYLESVMPSKLRLDQLYVRNRSFWLDLDILLWTLLALAPNRAFSPTKAASRGEPSEISLFSGPISRLFCRYVSWFTLDIAVTLLAMGLTGLFWRSLGPLNVGLLKAIPVAITFALLFSVTNWLLGVNRISWTQAGFADMLDLLPSAALATLLALVINWLLAQTGWPPLPVGMVIAASTLSLTGFILVRYRSRLLGGLAERWFSLQGGPRAAGERVLIIGGGDTGQYAAWLLSGRSGLGLFKVCGYVDDDLYKQGMRINGTRVLGRREDIPRLVGEHDIGILVFAIHRISVPERQRLLEICARTPARVVLMPDLQTALSLAASPGGDQSKLLFPVWQREGSYLPAQFGAWLDRLSEAAQAGDLASVEDQISAMRERMSMSVGEDSGNSHPQTVE